jgi:DNA-binding PadR family transcriptional regulator
MLQKGNYLGEFEEIVLLTVGILQGEAYGVSLKQALEARMSRSVSVGALHAALRRLEQKGYLHSRLGEATAVRGGKRKRYFEITVYGYRALQAVKDMRNQLWEDVPPMAFDV